MYIFLLAFNLISFVNSRDISQVTNGEADHRYLIQIRIKRIEKTSHCSGSILSENWILCAAHCFKHDGIFGASIIRHMDQKYRPEIQIELSNVITHPAFIRNGSYTIEDAKHDLSLLKMMKPFQFNNIVQPVKLGVETPLEDQAVVAGYGPGMPWKGEVTLSYWQGVLCSHAWGDMAKFGKGDSGGPLESRGYLIGVVSGERRQHHKKRPTVHVQCYADVASNIDWINSVMKQYEARELEPSWGFDLVNFIVKMFSLS